MTDSTKDKKVMEALNRAFTVATQALPQLDPANKEARFNATSHLTHYLLPFLGALAETISPLPPTAADTIIYLHLPLLLDALRKHAHDARGAQYEAYCVAYGLTEPTDLAAAWELVEALWDHANMRACAFALKFGDSLRMEKATGHQAKRGVDRATQTDEGDGVVR